jgi:hypothetical protein
MVGPPAPRGRNCRDGVVSDRMGSNGRVAPPSIFELRTMAREAGVGNVAEPAPVRLDDLRRELTANQVRVARLARLTAAKAS